MADSADLLAVETADAGNVVDVQTPFRTRDHGFPFPNSFPVGTPVVVVPGPWGPIHIGDASGGLCGGMILAALDFFLHGKTRPAAPTPAVVRYLASRLLDSWQFPFGVLRYYDGMRRPDQTRAIGGVPVVEGAQAQSLRREWPRLRASLDAGMPTPLGIIYATGWDPRGLARNHQVLALGYRLDGGFVQLRIYDPNYPNDDTAELQLELNPAQPGRRFRHSCEGATIRGFFVTEYSRPATPPPDLD